MSVAIAGPGPEQPRDRAGRFGHIARAEPDRAYDRDMAEYEAVSAARGSFQFPEPGAFDGTLEDHLDFYLNVPIPEELVRRAAEAYERAYEAAIDRAWKQGIEDVHQDDATADRIASLPHTEWVEATRAAEREWGQRYVDAERERWPGNDIHPFRTRMVLRIAQAVRLSSTLRDDGLERLLQTTHTWENGRVETYDELTDRYHTVEWIEDAL